jgi:hypothetical protein
MRQLLSEKRPVHVSGTVRQGGIARASLMNNGTCFQQSIETSADQIVDFPRPLGSSQDQQERSSVIVG